MIDAIDNGTLKKNISRRGPRIEKTATAQMAVDEFLTSNVDACKVDWRSIDTDFDMAKRAIAYRINHSKSLCLDGADDLGMRSNRDCEEIYLVHLDRL